MTDYTAPWLIATDVPGHEIGYRAIVDADGYTVCNPSPMGEANAALIAAAPLLMRALGSLLDLADTDYIDEDNAPIIEAARAALKAATAVGVTQ